MYIKLILLTNHAVFVITAGNETWRSKDGNIAADLVLPAPTLTIDTNTRVFATDQAYLATLPSPSPRLTSPSARLSDQMRSGSTDAEDTGRVNDTRKPKRQLSVDATTRLTTDRPKKPRESADIEPISSPRDTEEQPSPREVSKTKAPNVLEILKATASEVRGKAKMPAQPVMRLVNSCGGFSLTITRPKNDAFECVAAITDR